MNFFRRDAKVATRKRNPAPGVGAGEERDV